MPNPNGNKNVKRSISADEVALKCSSGQADICYVVEVPHANRWGQMENVHVAITFDETRMVTGVNLIDPEKKGYYIDRPTVVVTAENTQYSPIKPGYYDAIKPDAVTIVDNNGRFENLATSLQFDAAPSNKNSLNIAERAAAVESVLTMSDWSRYCKPSDLIDVCNTAISAYDKIRSQEIQSGMHIGADDTVFSQRERVQRITQNVEWNIATREHLMDDYRKNTQRTVATLRHESQDATNTELERAIAKNKLNDATMNMQYNINVQTLLTRYGSQVMADGLGPDLGKGDTLSYNQLKNAIQVNTLKLDELAASGAGKAELNLHADYLATLSKAAEYHPRIIHDKGNGDQHVRPLMDQHLLERYDQLMSSRTSDNSLRTAMGMYGDMSTRDFDGFMRARGAIVGAIARSDEYQKVFHANADKLSVEQRREIVANQMLNDHPEIDRVYARRFMQSSEFLNMVNDRDYLYVRSIQGENVNENGLPNVRLKPEYAVSWGINDTESVADWKTRLEKVEEALKQNNALTSETAPLLLAQKQYIQDMLDVHKQLQSAKYDQIMSHGISKIHFEYSDKTEALFNTQYPEQVRLMRDAMLSKGMEFDFTTTDLQSAYKTYFALSDLKHFDATDTERVLSQLNALSDKSQKWTPEKIAKLMNGFAETQKANDKDEHEIGAMLVYLQSQRSLSVREMDILGAFSVIREQRAQQIDDMMHAIATDIQKQDFSLVEQIDKQIVNIATTDMEKVRLELKQSFDFKTALDFNFDGNKNDLAIVMDVLRNHDIRNDVVDTANKALQNAETKQSVLDGVRTLTADSSAEDVARVFGIRFTEDETRNKIVRLVLTSPEMQEEITRLQQMERLDHDYVLGMQRFETQNYHALVRELQAVSKEEGKIPESLHVDMRLLDRVGYIEHMANHAREEGYEGIARAFKGISRDHSYSDAMIAQSNLAELLHTTQMTKEEREHAFDAAQQITYTRLAQSNPEHYMALRTIADEKLERIYEKVEVPQHVQQLVNAEKEQLSTSMGKLASQLEKMHYNESQLDGTIYISKTPKSNDAAILRYQDIAKNSSDAANTARQALEKTIHSNEHFAAFDKSAEKTGIQLQIQALDKRIADLESLQKVRQEHIDSHMQNRASVRRLEAFSAAVGRVGMHVNNGLNGNAEGLESLGRRFGSWLADRAEEKKEKKPWAITRDAHAIKELETKYDDTAKTIDGLREQRRMLEEKLHHRVSMPSPISHAINDYLSNNSAENARMVVVQVVAIYGNASDKAQVNKLFNASSGTYDVNDPSVAKFLMHAKDIQLPASFDQRNAFYSALSGAARDLVEEYKKMPAAEAAQYMAPMRALTATAEAADQKLQELDKLEQSKMAYKTLDSVMKHSSNLSEQHINECLAKMTQNATSLNAQVIADAIKEAKVEEAKVYESAYKTLHMSGREKLNGIMSEVEQGTYPGLRDDQHKNVLLQLRTFNAEVNNMSEANKQTIVDSVYSVVAKNFDVISREEEQAIKGQLRSHLFSEVGTSTMKSFINDNAATLDEYQEKLKQPKKSAYDALDVKAEDVKTAVTEHYVQPLDVKNVNDAELAKATMAIVKDNGAITDGNSQINESTFERGMKALQAQDPESYQQCMETIKKYELNENDGLANANRAVMKDVAEKLEREVITAQEEEKTNDETKTKANDERELA